MTARLVFDGEAIAPSELESRAARLAGALDRAGVGEDDVVALFLRNEPAYLEAMLACRRLGAYHCPVNWHFKADEAGFILRDSGAKVLLARDDLLAHLDLSSHPDLEVVRDVAAFRDASAPWNGAPRQPRGNMPYTSGTTGRPKGVRRRVATAGQRELATALYRTVLGIEPGVRALLSAPLYHSAPNLYALQAALVLAERDPGYGTDMILRGRIVAAEQVTDVRAGAEARPRPGDDQHPDGGVGGRTGEHVGQLGPHARRHCVALLGAVDGQHGDRAVPGDGEVCAHPQPRSSVPNVSHCAGSPVSYPVRNQR